MAPQRMTDRYAEVALEWLGYHGRRTPGVGSDADLQFIGPDQFLPILLDCHVVTRRVARRDWRAHPTPLRGVKIGFKVERRQMFCLLHRPDVLYAPPLTRAAAIVGNRGHVADRGD